MGRRAAGWEGCRRVGGNGVGRLQGTWLEYLTNKRREGRNAFVVFATATPH